MENINQTVYENTETILQELSLFNKPLTVDVEVSPLLDQYLRYIAKTGDTVYPWFQIKGFLKHVCEKVLESFHESSPTDKIPPCPNVEVFSYETMCSKIFEQIDNFTSAPFTIQRVCELLSAPKKHYKRTDKFMRGLEKNLLVVTTVEPGKAESSKNDMVNGDIDESAQVPSSNISLCPSSEDGEIASTFTEECKVGDNLQLSLEHIPLDEAARLMNLESSESSSEASIVKNPSNANVEPEAIDELDTETNEAFEVDNPELPNEKSTAPSQDEEKATDLNEPMLENPVDQPDDLVESKEEVETLPAALNDDSINEVQATKRLLETDESTQNRDSKLPRVDQEEVADDGADIKDNSEVAT
uniref:EOG090X0BWU n=1 Tax=Lynceus sp. MCZ IZ 141354 TaxID=1930659 RepID=A0A9N6WYT3_9CRUS|nr:EOG090X0BWU [Lynceus sp. MCZ IZ 141354]